MLQHRHILLFAALGLGTLGCGAQQAAKTAKPNETAQAVDSRHSANAKLRSQRNSDENAEKTNSVSLNGINIVYPQSLKNMQISMISDVLRLKFEEFVIQVNDGEILVDGESFGGVSSGDELSIGSNGEIYVNRQRRDRE